MYYILLYRLFSTILYYTINRVDILVCFVIKPHIKAYTIDYTCAHTSYLSQTPQTCLCKNFLSGVNFSRLSEKMHMFDFFRDMFSVFGAFSRFFLV